MEEDEEVIIEGSSLHKHLVDVGLLDNEVTSFKNKLEEDFQSYLTNEKAEEPKWKIDIWYLLLRFYDAIDVEKNLQKFLFLKIIQSDLIEDEDILYIEHLLSNFEVFQSENGLKHEQFNSEHLFQNSFLISFVWCGLIALFSANIYYWNEVTSLVWSFMIFLLLFGVAFKFLIYTILILSKDKINCILQLMIRLKKVSLKSLRILKEMKLYCTIQSVNEYTWRNRYQCEEISIYKLLDFIFSIYSCYLKENVGLLHSPVCNLDELFSQRFPNWDSSSQIDFIHIKERRNQFLFQTSGFLTRILLLQELSSGFLNKFLFYHWLLTCQGKTKPIIAQLNILDKLLKASEAFWSRDFSRLNNKENNYKNIQNNLLIALHSLSFHAKNAIAKIEDFNEVVERDSSGSEDLDDSYDVALNRCREIEYDFQSCNGCLDELKERLKKHFWKETDCDNRLAPVRQTAVETPAETSCVPFCDAQPPPIVDEVFEAYVDEGNRDLRIDDPDCLIDRRRDNEARAKRKKQCGRVLQEIQPILHQRRRMWQEREREALNRRQNGAIVNEENTSICTEHKEQLSTLNNGIVDCDDEQLQLYKRTREQLDEDERRGEEDERINSVGKYFDCSSASSSDDGPYEESDTFYHDAHLSDSDERPIDWSTCGFSKTLSDNNEIRDNEGAIHFRALFMDEKNLKFRNNLNDNFEEVFGGVGEAQDETSGESD